MSARKKSDNTSREKCRLCQSDADLVDVFDKNIYDSKHLRNFILVTSGVEILESDVVSKKVCHRCCIIAVKSYKYRYNAIETDKMLKKESGQEYVPPVLTNILGLDMGTTKKIRSECDASIQTDAIFDHSQQNRQICSSNHKSVNKMLKTSKTIIVPKGILRDNISPVIVLDKDQTERYLRKHGKDVNEEINHCLHTLSLMGKCNLKQTVMEEPSTSRTLNRINFSNVKAIHDLIPKESPRPQVSRKRTSTQSLSALFPPKRQKLQAVNEESVSPRTSVAHSDDNSNDRRSPSPTQLLEPKGNDEIFECKLCQKIFDKRIMLYHHMKIHLKCKLCKGKFKSTDDFDEHLKSTCYLSIAKNLPSVKLVKVDEINSMKQSYPQLVQETPSDDDMRAECDIADEEVDDPIDNGEDSDEINLKSMLESAPTIKTIFSLQEDLAPAPEIRSSPNEEIINIETDKTSPKEDIINIDDDSDEDPSYMPTTPKAKSPTIKKAVPAHSVSVIHPEIDVQLTNSSDALVNNVSGKCKAHNLIVSLFEKYSKMNRVDTSSSTDYIPDASMIQCMGTQTNLLNMASELNIWKIPVVIRKHSKLSVSFVWHEMQNKKKTKSSIDWSNIKPIGIIPVKKSLNVVSAVPKKVMTSSPVNQSVKPKSPVIANQTLTMPTLQSTLPSDLLAIPTSTLYQTGPTSFTLAPMEPITNNILIQPNIYARPCVINTTNQIPNGSTNLIATSIPETSTTLVTTPYFIAKPVENRSTYAPVQPTRNMPSLNNNSPVSDNTTNTMTLQNNPPNEPSALPKYPLLRVRTNLH